MLHTALWHPQVLQTRQTLRQPQKCETRDRSRRQLPRVRRRKGDRDPGALSLRKAQSFGVGLILTTWTTHGSFPIGLNSNCFPSSCFAELEMRGVKQHLDDHVGAELETSRV